MDTGTVKFCAVMESVSEKEDKRAKKEAGTHHSPSKKWIRQIARHQLEWFSRDYRRKEPDIMLSRLKGTRGKHDSDSGSEGKVILR